MNCPVCEGVSLLMTERNGIEIDYCPKCRGVWLDRGELDKIIERSMSSTTAPAPVVAAPAAPMAPVAPVPPNYPPAQAPSYPPQQQAYPSNRPQSHHTPHQAPHHASHQNAHHDAAYYKKKKRESFFGELFDFD